MAKQAAPLTARQVETRKTPGLIADGGGLYLQIAPTGARTWIFRYQIAGRRRDMGLGSAAVFSLAEARDRARAARRLVADGIDPIEARRATVAATRVDVAKAMTFAECADRYIAAHKAGWKNPKHAAQWPATLAAYVYPVFGSLPVQAVDVGLVLKAVEPIWTVKPETAGRVRGRIESVLDWATARGHRTGDNPARWRGHLESLLPARNKVRRVEHHAALPYGEVGAFMAELREQKGLAARALEFAILTAARTGEVLGATWAEIDLEAHTWAVPAERMKVGREHKVPLSAPALAILKAIPKTGSDDRVFRLSNMALLMTLRRMERGELTTHGFRSTFRDWAAERTGFPAEVAEMALAHVVGDKVEAAYRRGDLFEKRRQLAEAWAKFCDAPPAAGRVVPIRASAAIE
jgi:integrase